MKSNCVILIHGLGRTKSSMKKLEKKLKRNNYKVINWSYSSLTKDLTELAFELYTKHEIAKISHDKIFFVTHSLGGIIVRRMMSIFNINKLDGMVMIAPPNNASSIAKYFLKNKLIKTVVGPSCYELGDSDYLQKTCSIPKDNTMVIAGTKSLSIINPNSWISQSILEKPHDGTISVKETKLPHMDKFFSVKASHTNIMKNHIVIKESINFLNCLERK